MIHLDPEFLLTHTDIVWVSLPGRDPGMIKLKISYPTRKEDPGRDEPGGFVIYFCGIDLGYVPGIYMYK